MRNTCYRVCYLNNDNIILHNNIKAHTGVKFYSVAIFEETEHFTIHDIVSLINYKFYSLKQEGNNDEYTININSEKLKKLPFKRLVATDNKDILNMFPKVKKITPKLVDNLMIHGVPNESLVSKDKLNRWGGFVNYDIDTTPSNVIEKPKCICEDIDKKYGFSIFSLADDHVVSLNLEYQISEGYKISGYSLGNGCEVKINFCPFCGRKLE